MKTRHHTYFENSKNMAAIPSNSVDLVVTSPPYPMIEIWDRMFAEQHLQIRNALKSRKSLLAFELMHNQLDEIWREIHRVLKDGGMACINVGDAARTINDNFMLYPNHARILSYLIKVGFNTLPLILWRKQTNAPNKFMGSGMLPSGAYVTLEHEYILILRKGPKREFKTDAEKKIRRESALFWEERNIWYSDVWLDLKGTLQKLDSSSSRLRSAAFPFDVPYRLINMFSVKGDTVLDPFLGTGTSMWAAIATARNSIGFEIDQSFRNEILPDTDVLVKFANQKIRDRIEHHLEFVQKRLETKGQLKYINKFYKFPVMTRQETELILNPLVTIAEFGENTVEVVYSCKPHSDGIQAWKEDFKAQNNISNLKKRRSKKKSQRPIQQKLL
ncbi:MAG: site-specific DNA-methyltransferase [Desulfobacterales bacterium]|nr:MAG: site-specific DNA-methyltransferase [Desulfobacterales bacterium]